jgi:nanoRNase/pAp phosphatase (c-di-AMP/oligoRNAs hydrolase)
MRASRADIQAIQTLYPLANLRMLSEIQRGRVQRDYFPILARALNSASVYGSCIISSLGDIDIPDMVGEVADLLLRDDRALWTLCYGFCQAKMLLSIRTSQTAEKADKVMQHLVARRGTGGGHASLAGGQIPLRRLTKAGRSRLEETTRRRFLQILNVQQHPAERLVAPWTNHDAEAVSQSEQTGKHP